MKKLEPIHYAVLLLVGMIVVLLTIILVDKRDDRNPEQLALDARSEKICSVVEQSYEQKGFISELDIVYTGRMVSEDMMIPYKNTGDVIYTAVKDYCPRYAGDVARVWLEDE